MPTFKVLRSERYAATYLFNAESMEELEERLNDEYAPFDELTPDSFELVGDDIVDITEDK